MAKSTLSLIVANLVSLLVFANLAFAAGELTMVSGQVEVGRGEPAKWAIAKPGDSLAANDRVRTGPDGRVEIKMDAGVLRVHENSMLRLPPAVSEADHVELERGRSLFDVLRRRGRRFEVHTPTVVVSVKGTRFGVDAGDDIGEVTVYRGTVGVRQFGAGETMETLVREGFLATGGVGVPVELDVSTASDPWQSWQRFDRAKDQDRRSSTRMRDVERAKATLHRATDADVIVKAAERRPEIAERLKKIQEKQREQARRVAKRTAGASGTDAGNSLPAAPGFDGTSPEDSRRETLERRLSDEARTMRTDEMQRRALEARQLLDAARTNAELRIDESLRIDELAGVANSSPGEMNLDFAAVYELSPSSLLLVRESLEDLQASYQDGSFVPNSPVDLMTELSNELVERGMTASDALTTVETLMGN